jgi:ribonucleotide reductase alpha subunit
LNNNYRWLTELSQLFLERDYLIKGQTVDERVNVICNTAERILQKPGFAKAFIDNFKKGWYSLSTPIWNNFGNDRGLPISCVVGDTWINTINGNKKAKDITIGDEVLTHKRRYKKVTNVIITEKRNDIYQLKVSGHDELYLTGDHPVLTSLGWVCTEELVPDLHLVATTSNYAPIILVEKTDKVETVYDFTVEEDHSFSASGIVLHNCFGSYIGDSMESIAHTWAEVCMMTKYGGGTSAYFGDIRERGALIKDNGESSGSVHFMSPFENLINVVSQGKCYIEGTEVLTDSGFKDFRQLTSTDKLAEVDECNNVSFTSTYELVIEDFDGELVCFSDGKSVIVKVTPNHRMVVKGEKVETKIVLAKDFQKDDRLILCGQADDVTQAIESLSVDSGPITITHEYYKGKVYCAVVSKGRLIVKYQDRVLVCGNTRRGNFAAYLPIYHPDIMEFLNIRSEGFPIQDLSFGVCVPDDWMQAMIDGDWDKRVVWARVLECRANTGFPYIVFIDTVNKNTVDVYKDKGLKIKHSNLCCVTGDQRVVSDRGLLTVKELYDQGGELTLFDGHKPVKASEMKLISENEDVYKITLENGMTHSVTKCHKIQTDKGMIRIDELKIGDQVSIQYKKGIFGKGSEEIWTATEVIQEQYIHNNSLFKKDLQLLLANLGIGSSLEGDNLSIDKRKVKHSAVKSIEYISKQPVYCCEVYTDEHVWVCNGIITSNSEIMLFNDLDESFVCDLSSMNILYYDEWKDTNAVELLVYLLDAVMTEFIEKARNIRFMERPVRFAERHRALGIGWLGWHSYLQSKMIPWESMEAKYYNVTVAKTIKESAYNASRRLAEEYGEPELLKGYGRRHVTTCVTGDTKILTSRGWVEIINTVGQQTDVWNGFEFSTVEPFITGISDIYEVGLSNGFSLKCTPDHLFRIISPVQNEKEFGLKKVLEVKASELRVGDCIQRFLLPVITEGHELNHAYTNGAFCGDGSISNSRKGKYPRKELRLYGKKTLMAAKIAWKSKPYPIKKSTPDSVRGYLVDDLKPKFFVPINYNLRSKLEWLAGIIDTDGSSGSNGVAITTSNFDFAKDIAFLLQTLGIRPYISKCTRIGGYKTDKSIYYSVQITSHGCSILNSLGINTLRVKIPQGKLTVKDCSKSHYVEVSSVTKLPEQQMTYCFTEPKRGTGIFNGIYTKQCAIAPTKSSAFILGQVSEGIEPHRTNYYIKDLQKGKFTIKNHHLEQLLREKGLDKKEIWDSILKMGGSVQHLSCLTQHEKDVFKTFAEISPKEIIIQAAQRQKYIDQSQSLNLMIHPSIPAKDVNTLMIEAWKMGIKSLYYQISVNAAQAFSREILSCHSCQ